VNKRIKKKKHLGKFREYGIVCELKLTPGSDVDAAFDAHIDFVESQGWHMGGGGDNKKMGHFISHNPWAGMRRVAQGNLTQADADKLSQWLLGQPWCAEITKLEVRDAWYGWEKN
jgi:uncharacterized protein YggL (DUF469 family)